MSDTPKQSAIGELRGKYPLPGVEKCHYCAEWHRKDEPCCAMAELALKDERISQLERELAAMTPERDRLIRNAEEASKIICDEMAVVVKCVELEAECERLNNALRSALGDSARLTLENERLRQLLASELAGNRNLQAERNAAINGRCKNFDAIQAERDRMRASYHRLLRLVGWNGDDEISESEIEDNLHESMVENDRLRELLREAEAWLGDERNTSIENALADRIRAALEDKQ